MRILGVGAIFLFWVGGIFFVLGWGDIFCFGMGGYFCFGDGATCVSSTDAAGYGGFECADDVAQFGWTLFDVINP